MKLSERMYKHGDTEDFTSIKAVYKWATEVAQLETEIAKLKRVTKGMDLQGLKSIATELAKREKPFSFPSLWRDTGTRQRRIGEQLLRLIDALLTEQE